MKRETLTPAEKEALNPDQNIGLSVQTQVLVWVISIVFTAVVFICVREDMQFQRILDEVKSEREARQHANELRADDRHSFEKALSQLQELADNGCPVSFSFCDQVIYDAQSRVLRERKREKIEFSTHGVTQANLDELKVKVRVRIASQKLAYLKAKGGAKLPSDIQLLEYICFEVYVYKRQLLGGNPTDAELKQLLPPGITKVTACLWDENK